jgi:hypothetical protein
MWKIRYIYIKILVEILERSECRLEDNIRIYIKEIGYVVAN